MAEDEEKSAEEMKAEMNAMKALIGRMKPLLEQADLDIEGAEDVAPEADLGTPDRQLARQIGSLVHQEDVYMRGELVGTVNKRGDWRPITPDRFGGWLEEYCKTFRASKEKGKVAMSMKADQARRIMAQDEFRDRVRVLRSINRVHLPVFRNGQKLEMLPLGYDEESEIFTVSEVDYERDWTLERAREWLMELLGDYPWADRDERGEDGKVKPLELNRSLAVQVFAMLGVYCREIFGPGELRPMIVAMANQQGSGKSMLVRIALSPVFGVPQDVAWPSDDKERVKILDRAAIGHRPYVFIDDVQGGLFSADLNRFITSAKHEGHRFHSQEGYSEMAETQLFTSGNGIELTKDLWRRSMIVELFMAGMGEEREFGKVIDEQYIVTDEFRSQALAAFWAMVREWDAEGRLKGATKPSFGPWTSTIGGIVMNAGFGDPMARVVLPVGGNSEEREWEDLIKSLCHGCGDEEDEFTEESDLPVEGSRTFTREDIVARARKMEILERFVPAGTKELNQSQNVKLGLALAKWKGRILRDKDARTFEFGRRKLDRGQAYTVTVQKVVEEDDDYE